MQRLVSSNMHGFVAAILAVFCQVAVFAQTPSILLMTKDTTFRNSHSMVLAGGNGMIGSNAMDIQFFRKMAYGGHLEDDHLKGISDQLHDVNRFGASASANINFYSFSDSLFGRPHWGLNVQASTNNNAHLSYSHDLFDLVFRGNSMFTGRRAQLAPLSGEYQAWQKFGVGIFNKKNFSGVSLSLVSGQDYQNINVRNSTLYTSPYADSLVLEYSGDYYRADTSKSGWGSGKGIGIASDFQYNLPLDSAKGFISITIRDLGVVSWNNSSEHFRFDSQTTWTGFTSDDLLQFSSDSIQFDGLKDSIHYDRDQKKMWKMLPLSVHLRIMRTLGKSSFYEAGLSIWPNRTALPMIYAGMNHTIGQRLLISERISLGGYGRWGVGAQIQWMPRGNWLLSVGSNNLGGFVFDKAHSRDLNFTIARFFKRSAKNK